MAYGIWIYFKIIKDHYKSNRNCITVNDLGGAKLKGTDICRLCEQHNVTKHHSINGCKQRKPVSTAPAGYPPPPAVLPQMSRLRPRPPLGGSPKRVGKRVPKRVGEGTFGRYNGCVITGG